MSNNEEKEVTIKISDEFKIGDKVKVKTFMGREKNIVGRLIDGRIILFNKENPFLPIIGPGEVVEAKISYVAQKYIIVDPISPPKEGVNGLKESLKELIESEDWEIAVIAKSLLYLIDKKNEE